MEIRHLSLHEVQSIAVVLAQQEGWNPGFGDAQAFFAADKQGFLGGFIKGEPIACISAVRYPDNFAFLGFYIVRPEFRGKGYGIQIWQAAMHQMQGYNIGLDGVTDQQPNYMKSGFQLAYRNIRYSGTKTTETTNNNCVSFEASMMQDIADFDRQCFPSSRLDFLTVWLNLPGSKVRLYYENKKLKGYGVIRPCYSGYKIGPLFAENEQTASAILDSLMAEIPVNAAFFIDMPESNLQANALIEPYKLEPVFETARMYTREAPKVNLSYVYGVTSFELG